MLCVKHVKHAERRNAYVLGVERYTEVRSRIYTLLKTRLSAILLM